MTSPLAARTIRSPKSRLNSRLLTARGVSCMPARYAFNAGMTRDLCATLCAGFREPPARSLVKEFGAIWANLSGAMVVDPEGDLIVGQNIPDPGSADTSRRRGSRIKVSALRLRGQPSHDGVEVINAVSILRFGPVADRFGVEFPHD